MKSVLLCVPFSFLVRNPFALFPHSIFQFGLAPAQQFEIAWRLTHRVNDEHFGGDAIYQRCAHPKPVLRGHNSNNSMILQIVGVSKTQSLARVSEQQVFKAVPLFEIKLIPECFGLEAIRK